MGSFLRILDPERQSSRGSGRLPNKEGGGVEGNTALREVFMKGPRFILIRGARQGPWAPSWESLDS